MMRTYMFALTAVEDVTYYFDRPYAYIVPEELSACVFPGMRAIVPFGKANRLCRAVILSLDNDPAQNLKPIQQLLDKAPLISQEQLDLASWIKGHCFCTLYDALRLMFPPGPDVKLTRQFSLNPDINPEALSFLTEDEKQICGLLQKKPLTKERLLSDLGLDKSSNLPESLVRRGILFMEDCTKEQHSGSYVSMARAAVSDDEIELLLCGKELTKKQKAVLKLLHETGSATAKELCYFSGVTTSVIHALEKKGIIELFEERVLKSPYPDTAYPQEPAPILSTTQENAYYKLLSLYSSGAPAAALLFGVTGSGKTQVYMKLIEQARTDGKGVLMLVPEISLTPQAVALFYSRFGRDVAVLHSGLSIGERQDEWQRIHEGSAHIVIGTRSAVFAPIQDLGLIIIDEEQEHTYKSESSPRYHARDVARFRCAKNNALLILSSATPSVESFYAASSGRYTLIRLDDRYGAAKLPDVIIVDMKRELVAGNDGPFSSILLAELQENLRRGEQSILLLNRRGYNTFVYCIDCGHVMTCPHCSVSLTYHSANGRMMCHTCGYSRGIIDTCPSCHGHHIRYSGQGTQKAEDMLGKLLPEAKILRMDTDTTSSKFSHVKLLNQFENGDYDILIGTQMVAKGLDFPNVTLVGVLSADQSLYSGDFRAGERTFSLLTQVAGRAGRGNLRGRAVIQTGTPDNEIIRLAASQDYDSFYNLEISLRRSLLYPPFCDLCIIGFSGHNENEAKDAAGAFFSRLNEEIAKQEGLPARIMGPLQATVYKAGGNFRYQILIKCKNNNSFRTIISRLLIESGSRSPSKRISVYADINPLSMI